MLPLPIPQPSVSFLSLWTCLFHIHGLTEHRVFKSHPCQSVCPCFVPVYGRVIFHCMDGQHSTCPAISGGHGLLPPSHQALGNLPTLQCVYLACFLLLPGFPSSRSSRFTYPVPSTSASRDSRHPGTLHLIVAKNLLGVQGVELLGRREAAALNALLTFPPRVAPAPAIGWSSRASAVVMGVCVCVVAVVLTCISEL